MGWYMTTQEYSRISDCGEYGIKPHGGGSTGGELWAWINTEFATKVGYLMDVDNFEIGIDEFEEEMRYMVAELDK